MPTEYFDTSLAEAGLFLAKVLLVIDASAIAAGLLTLPLFLLVLGTIRGWFWAVDETTNPVAHGTRRSAGRRLGAFALAFGVPVASLAATLFVLGFFGVLDFTSQTPRPPIKSAVEGAYDRATRTLAESMANKDPIVADPTNPTPEAEQIQMIKDERARKPLQAIRALSMLAILLIGPFPTLVVILSFVAGRKGVNLVFRSLSRNLVRTALTYLAIFVLVIVITSIWSILGFLAALTAEKDNNLKAIVTERYQIPSMMKPTHLQTLKDLIDELPPEQRPKNGDDDFMTWAFIAGSLDPTKRSPENVLFFFCMEPRKFLSMMPGIEDLTDEQVALIRIACEKMENDVTKVVIGKERLRQMKKRVGDRLTFTAFSHPGLVFELQIIAELPDGRYGQSSVMNRAYLDRSLQAYEGINGKPHPNADKSLNLIWLRMPNKLAFEALAEKVNSSGKFNPAVKIETESSGTATWLDALKDQLWFLRWMLTPALLATMALVISNAITISVRERMTEMAVLKVLGFRPWMVSAMVLGEAVLVGTLAGFMATATAYALINSIGGIPMPIAWFPAFKIPAAALWWGPAIGATMAFIGSLLPAWTARSVKASEVFAKVA